MRLLHPFRLIRRREHGSAVPQSVILAAVGIAIILGLYAYFTRRAMPAVAGGVDAIKSGTGRPTAPGSTTVPGFPPLRPHPKMPGGGVAPAANRVAQMPELDLAQKIAAIGYAPPTDPTALAEYNRIRDELMKKYRIVRVDENISGFNGAVLYPLDENDKQVIFTIGGTADAMDWLVDGGQVFRPTSTGEALGMVGGGLALLSPKLILSATLHHALGNIAQWQYDGGLTIAQALIQKHSVQNVVVLGHSLAGGIANYINLRTGARGYGFNSAPISPATLDRIRGQIVAGSENTMTHINSRGEIVSDLTPVVSNGVQTGEVITVEGKTGNILTDHFLGNIDLKKPIHYLPPRPLP